MLANVLDKRKLSSGEARILLRDPKELEGRFSKAIDTILETEKVCQRVSLDCAKADPAEIGYTKWRFNELDMKDPPVWPKIGEEKHLVKAIGNRTGYKVSSWIEDQVDAIAREIATKRITYSLVRNQRGRYVALSGWMRLLNEAEMRERNLDELDEFELIDVLLNGRLSHGMVISCQNTADNAVCENLDIRHWTLAESVFTKPKTLIYLQKK
jgi:hypothetical protein